MISIIDKWLHVEIFIDMYEFTGQYTHIYFLALASEGLGAADTPVAMSTPSPQILVSNSILQ